MYHIFWVSLGIIVKIFLGRIYCIIYVRVILIGLIGVWMGISVMR